MVFDAAHDRVVLFGGYSNSGGDFLDTWTWDGSTWTQLSPANSPTNLSIFASMAYDASHGNSVLFGRNSTGWGVSPPQTWTWDGTNWTLRQPATSPPERDYGAMAYDASHGNVVLWGGYGDTGWLSDTWIWDGANWTQVASAAVCSGEGGAYMAYDATRHNIVLAGEHCGDTWIWDGSTWTKQNPETSHLPIKGGMAYDGISGNVVLFGGEYNASGETWTWDGTNWTLQSPLDNPQGRELPGFVYDSIHRNLVLFGGFGGKNDSFFNDTWTYGAVPTSPSLTSPTSSPLSGSTQFIWNPGSEPTGFELCIGIVSPSTCDIYDSGVLASTVTSETVTIPALGDELYVRLSFLRNGSWKIKDYTFLELAVTPPSLTAPTTSPLFGYTVFSWDQGGGIFGNGGLYGVQLTVGTGGPGTNDLFDTGRVSPYVSWAMPWIPPDGKTLYVRLSYLMNGTWSFKDYRFTEALPPSLTSPTTSPLSGSTQFVWNRPGPASWKFQLRMGVDGPNAHDIYNSGILPSTFSSETVTIPSDGVTVYVRFFYLLRGTWSYKDYTFTEAGTAVQPSLTSPTATQLSGSTQFTWNPGVGAAKFQLRMGTVGPDAHDIYNSGVLADTVTSETVSIPSNGATLYVRLFYLMNGTWNYKDYTFTEAGTPTPPGLTSPTASPLSGSTQFTWNPGVGAAEFQLRVGTVGLDAHDIYNSGVLANTVTSETVSIPSDGVTLYVRLFYRMNGTWGYRDYTFTEAGTATPPGLTSPIASPLSGSTQFTWNPGVGAAKFQLRMGTVGPNAHDIYNSGALANTVTSETVSIPSNGVTLYVRLFYLMNGTWGYRDYTFTEAP
jgi:hypothetical protein